MLGFSSFEILFQVLINGILFGTMYGIAALGLSLIFGTMQIIFITQGAMIILAAYGAFWLHDLLAIDPFVSIAILVPVALVVGAGIYQLLFRKLAGRGDAGKAASLLVAFGLMYLLENFMSITWSPNPRAIQTDYTSTSIALMGVKISFTRLMAFFMAIAATAIVTVFLRKTMLGKAIRAAAENMESARIVGIKPHWVKSLTFAIGVCLASLAGIATATTYSFDPYFGFIFSLKAMIALALGGMGSIIGALCGGIILGIIESMGAYIWTGGWADVLSYTVFLLVIMFKPEGLFVRRAKDFARP